MECFYEVNTTLMQKLDKNWTVNIPTHLTYDFQSKNPSKNISKQNALRHHNSISWATEVLSKSLRMVSYSATYYNGSLY